MYTIADSGDAESIGFAVKHYVDGLFLALHTTGDPQFLDEALDVMDVLAAWIDTHGDLTPTNKDVPFLTALFASVAAVCEINRAQDARYATAADDWTAYALYFVHDLYGGTVVYNALYHDWVAKIEAEYWLWWLTEDSYFHGAKDNHRDDLLTYSFYDEAGAWWCYHSCPVALDDPSIAANGVAQSTYFSNVLASLVKLNVMGYTIIELEALAATTLNIIHASGPITVKIDGSGGLEAATLKQGARLFGIVSDADGAIDTLETAFYNQDPSADQRIYIPVGLLMSEET